MTAFLSLWGVNGMHRGENTAFDGSNYEEENQKLKITRARESVMEGKTGWK